MNIYVAFLSMLPTKRCQEMYLNLLLKKKNLFTICSSVIAVENVVALNGLSLQQMWRLS